MHFMISRRLQLLVERHQSLDDEADELSAKKFLLPSEQGRLKLVKVLRLKAKEAVDRFRIEQGMVVTE